MRKRKSKKIRLPKTPIVYPSGSCVKSEAGVFYIRNGRRFRIPTQRVLDSWAFPRIIITSEAALSKYRVAGRMGFRDGSLIYNIADGKIYLISDNKKRHITSPEALERIGADIHDATRVSDYEASLQEEGNTLN